MGVPLVTFAHHVAFDELAIASQRKDETLRLRVRSQSALTSEISPLDRFDRNQRTASSRRRHHDPGGIRGERRRIDHRRKRRHGVGRWRIHLNPLRRHRICHRLLHPPRPGTQRLANHRHRRHLRGWKDLHRHRRSGRRDRSICRCHSCPELGTSHARWDRCKRTAGDTRSAPRLDELAQQIFYSSKLIPLSSCSNKLRCLSQISTEVARHKSPYPTKRFAHAPQ